MTKSIDLLHIIVPKVTYLKYEKVDLIYKDKTRKKLIEVMERLME